MKARTQVKSDMFTLDNNNHTMMIQDADNTNLNDHNSHEDQLWNKELLKNYVLDVLNMLEFSYPTSSKISSALLINATY